MAQLKDNVPPHNLDAEQAVLGALLLDWDSIGKVHSLLSPDKFYSFQNQKIYKAILDLYGRGVRGDLISIRECLSENGELEASGGPAYLAELANKVPTSANVEYYAKVVLDAAIRRDLIKTAANLVVYAHDETKEYSSVLEEAQKDIYSLTQTSSKSKISDTKELVSRAINNIQKAIQNKTSVTGIPSGITKLDQLTAGFQNSEMIILGARPSIGKTAMALSMLQYIAFEKQIPAAFFSLEMADVQIMQRLLVQESRIRADSVRTGFLSKADYLKLQDAAGKIYDAPLYIVDSPNMKMLDLRAMARQLKEQFDIKIMFVDYIGLISGEPGQKDYERVSESSRSLKSLARELDIPIVVLSQVARSSEGTAPNLAQLRDSGSIEQDADVVMFLHRERKAEDDNQPGIKTQLIVAKQRNGPIGDVDVLYLPHFTKFENIADGE
ncbi:MAG: replicative DNA helicase [Treponemataceae bacterium]|nr:replicative DNA helicase [Treponemataceae bacterium]